MKNINFLKILALLISLTCVLSALVACKPAETEQTGGDKELSINGTAIGDYTIIYSDKNPAAQQISASLAAEIRRISGEIVVVKSDIEKYKSGKEILVGHSNRTAEGGVADSFLAASAELAKDEMILAGEGEFVFLGGASGNNASIKGAVNELIKAMANGGAITLGAPEAKKIDGLLLYKIITFNDGGNSEGNISWACAMLDEFDADIIGLQEVIDIQVSEYKKRLKSAEYGSIFFGNAMTGKNKYDSLILYKLDKFELLDSGIKWLSDTPDVPYSMYYGSYAPQAYNYALFRDKETGFEFAFVNTHLSYDGKINKIQVPQLLELTAEFRDKHVIYAADWNMTVNSDGFKSMVNAGFTDTGTAYGKVIANSQKYIDHIFVDTNYWTVNYHSKITSHKHSSGGTMPASDHDPVYAELAVFLNN